jgi:hypothetical protein
MTEEERRRQELHLDSLGGYIVYSNDVERSRRTYTF